MTDDMRAVVLDINHQFPRWAIGLSKIGPADSTQCAKWAKYSTDITAFGKGKTSDPYHSRNAGRQQLWDFGRGATKADLPAKAFAYKACKAVIPSSFQVRLQAYKDSTTGKCDEAQLVRPPCLKSTPCTVPQPADAKKCPKQCVSRTGKCEPWECKGKAPARWKTQDWRVACNRFNK